MKFIVLGSKNRLKDKALDLSGLCSTMKHNTQIVVGDQGRRDVGEEARQGWSVWGPVITLIWAEI